MFASTESRVAQWDRNRQAMCSGLEGSEGAPEPQGGGDALFATRSAQAGVQGVGVQGHVPPGDEGAVRIVVLPLAEPAGEENLPLEEPCADLAHALAAPRGIDRVRGRQGG